MPTPNELKLLEDPVPFSQSRLWGLQREWYAAHGPKAWTEGIVPSQVSTSPLMAAAYVRTFLGLLEGLSLDGQLDPTTPIRLLEIGTGAGRFGWRLWQALQAERRPHLPPIQVVLVDIVDANLAALESHPRLQAGFLDGTLATAWMNAEEPGSFTPRKGQLPSPYGPGGWGDAPVLLALNYVLDSLRADCWEVRGGALMEVKVGLACRGEPSGEDLLSRVVLLEEPEPPSEGPWYGESEGGGTLNALLAHYRESGDEGRFLVPTAPLQLLSAIRGWARGPMLALVGDKGHRSRETMLDMIQLSFHGATSIMVNFHALAWWATQEGGAVWYPERGHTSFDIGAYLLPAPGQPLPATGGLARAFSSSVDDGIGPLDILPWSNALDAKAAHVDEILSLIVASRFDPWFFHAHHTKLLEEKLTPLQLTRLTSALFRVVEQALVHPGELDTCFLAGQQLYERDRYAEARVLFERSEAELGWDSATAFNIAACLAQEGETDAAIAQLHALLDRKPDAERAMKLLEDLVGQL